MLAGCRYLSLFQVEGTAYAMAVGIAACAILVLIAYVQARTTVYTITTKRVVMRVGAALTITFNFPYNKISNANLGLRRDGTGTITFELAGYNKVSYLVLWPHVHPWKMSSPQPALRCIVNPEEVAKILADAAQTQINTPQVARSTMDTRKFIAAE